MSSPKCSVCGRPADHYGFGGSPTDRAHAIICGSSACLSERVRLLGIEGPHQVGSLAQDNVGGAMFGNNGRRYGTARKV